MRKSLVAAVALVLVIAATFVGSWSFRHDARAQDGAIINGYISERRYGWADSNLIEGSDCSFSGEQFGNYNSNRMHIVVRNQDDTVIAVHEIRGTIIANVEFDFYTCEEYLEVQLPEAAFYVISINDTYYTTAPGNAGSIDVSIVREWEEDWHPVVP